MGYKSIGAGNSSEKERQGGQLTIYEGGPLWTGMEDSCLPFREFFGSCTYFIRLLFCPKKETDGRVWRVTVHDDTTSVFLLRG